MDLDLSYERKPWLQLAAEASTEQDARRLIALVKELCQALDREACSRIQATEDCV